jgi:hypothetical protein
MPWRDERGVRPSKVLAAGNTATGRCALNVLPFLHNGVGRTAHCREPVVARGQFINGSGKRWRVDACEENTGAQRNGGSEKRLVPADPVHYRNFWDIGSRSGYQKLSLRVTRRCPERCLRRR